MIENHVTNLELSRRLKELGVPQKSKFYWVDGYKNYKMTSEAYNGWIVRPMLNWMEKSKADIEASAFLASELGEMLPPQIISGVNEPWITITKATDNTWDVRYYSIKNGTKYDIFDDISLTDALAKMLIYLLENKLIKLEETK